MLWTLLSDAPALDPGRPAHHADPAAVLNLSPAAAGAILVETTEWQRALDWASRLRAHAPFARLPLYLAQRPFGPEPPEAQALFDGIATDATVRDQEASEILAQGQRFAEDAKAPGEALAQYLACRPARRLVPVRDWKAAGYYRHPVVEALLGATEDAFVWLERWSRRRILDVDMTVDRLRVCDQCSSAHLSFVDVCPACASLDIADTRLLHCFTCGHVDNQANFQRQHALECPKCHAVLRHIGVDYDRPIEQHQCRHCKNLFVDADVRSACMACGSQSAPEQLPVRHVAVYRLGGAGLLLARQGNLSPVLSGLDTVNYIAPALFERLIDWQVGLARRYPESHFFCVIGLRVRNLDALVDTLGRGRSAALIDGFAERLRATLRVTDLTTRGDDDHIWLLTPHTDEASGRLLVGRIHALAEATRQPDGTQLELAATVLPVPGEADQPQEGNQLMGLMASRLEDDAPTAP